MFNNAKRTVVAIAMGGLVGAATLFAATPANAARPAWATGAPDLTSTATNAEVREAVDAISTGVTFCGLLGPVQVACQLSYDAHGPGEMEDIANRGCDLQQQTWINPQSIGSWDRSYTSYEAINC